MVQTAEQAITQGDGFDLKEDNAIVPLRDLTTFTEFAKHKKHIENALGTPLVLEIVGDTPQIRIDADGDERQKTRKAIQYLLKNYEERRAPNPRTPRPTFDEDFISKRIKEAFYSEEFIITFPHARDAKQSPLEHVMGFLPNERVLDKITSELGVHIERDPDINSFEITLNVDYWDIQGRATGKAMPPKVQNKIMGEALTALCAAIQKPDISFTTLLKEFDKKAALSIQSDHAFPKNTGESQSNDTPQAKVTQKSASNDARIFVFIEDETRPVFEGTTAPTIKRGALSPIAQKHGVIIKSPQKDDKGNINIRIQPKNASTKPIALLSAKADLIKVLQQGSKDSDITRKQVELRIDPVARMKERFANHNHAFIPTAFTSALPDKDLKALSENMAFELVKVDGGYQAFSSSPLGIERAKMFLEQISPRIVSMEKDLGRKGYEHFLKQNQDFAEKEYRTLLSRRDVIQGRLDDLNNSKAVKEAKIIEQQQTEKEQLNIVETSPRAATRKKAESAANKASAKIEQFREDIKALDIAIWKIQSPLAPEQLLEMSEEERIEEEQSRPLEVAGLRAATAEKILRHYETLSRLYSRADSYTLNSDAIEHVNAKDISTPLLDAESPYDYSDMLKAEIQAAYEALEQAEINSIQPAQKTKNAEADLKNFDAKHNASNEEQLSELEQAERKKLVTAHSSAKRSLAAAKLKIQEADEHIKVLESTLPERMRREFDDIDEIIYFHQFLFKTKRGLENGLEEAKQEVEQAGRALKSVKEQFDAHVKKGKDADPWLVTRNENRLKDAKAEVERQESALARIEELEEEWSKPYQELLSSVTARFKSYEYATSVIELHANTRKLAETNKALDAASGNTAGTTTQRAKNVAQLGELTSQQKILERKIKNQTKEIAKPPVKDNSLPGKIEDALVELKGQKTTIYDDVDLSLLDTTTPTRIKPAALNISKYDLVNRTSIQEVLNAYPLDNNEADTWHDLEKEVSKERQSFEEVQRKERAAIEERLQIERRFANLKNNKKPEENRILNGVRVSGLARFLGEQDDHIQLHELQNSMFSTLGIVFEPTQWDENSNKWGISLYPSKQAKKNEQYKPVIEQTLGKIALAFQNEEPPKGYQLTDFIDDFRRNVSAFSTLKGYRSEPAQSFNHPEAHAFFTSQNREPLLENIERVYGIKILPAADREKGRFDVYVRNTDDPLFAHANVSKTIQVFDAIIRMQKRNDIRAEQNKNKNKAGQVSLTAIDRNYISNLAERAQSGSLSAGKGTFVYDPEDEDAMQKLREAIEKDVRRELQLEAEQERNKQRKIKEEAEEGRKASIVKLCEELSNRLEKNPLQYFTNTQRKHWKALGKNQVTIANGPPATGKTHMAVRMAVEKFIKGEVDSIVIARPAIESGERLGFLRGDAKQKLSPYTRPIYDILYEMLGEEATHQLEKAGHLHVEGIGFLRGRTLKNAFVIIDEPQNMTIEQTRMVHTRLGQDLNKAMNTFYALCGDTKQVDLADPKMSGYAPFLDMVAKSQEEDPSFLSELEVVNYTEKDAKTRAPYVEKITTLFNTDPTFSRTQMTIASLPMERVIELAEAANDEHHGHHKYAKMALRDIFDKAEEHERVLARISIDTHFNNLVQKRLRVMFNEEVANDNAAEIAPTVFSKAMFDQLARHMNSDNAALRHTATTTYERIAANASDEEIAEMYHHMAALHDNPDMS